MPDKWTAAEVDVVQAAIFLKRGQMRKPVPMPASPRGTLASGPADFRGFPLTEVTAVSIEDTDFTGARAPKNQFGAEQSIQLQDVIAERCVFNRAGRFHRLNGHFSACSFRKITTHSCSVIGAFTDCDFSGARTHISARGSSVADSTTAICIWRHGQAAFKIASLPAPALTTCLQTSAMQRWLTTA